MAEKDLEGDEIRQRVAEYYAGIAGRDSGCGCSPSTDCCGGRSVAENTVSTGLGYSAAELEELPAGADMGLGCGNPVAIAGLKPGEVVLDLGSGGGIDCFLAARRVGLSGRVIGVDMTPDMVAKARQNAMTANAANVEFRLGELERLPVADASVDVTISNCVINLSPDKQQTYQEAFRVLKPGGRLTISDIVATEEVPEEIRKDAMLWSQCIGGAMTVHEVEKILSEIGFEQIRVMPVEKSRQTVKEWLQGRAGNAFVSALIEAVKPL